jgi:hypothetical protein
MRTGYLLRGVPVPLLCCRPGQIVEKRRVLPETHEQRRGLRQASLGKGDNEHDVSLKPFIGTLRVESPSRRA